MPNHNFIGTSIVKVAAIFLLSLNGFFTARVGNASPSTDNQLSLYANIETAGVLLRGVNLPKTAELLYRQSGETDWHNGHPLIRIDSGPLVGSLFGLSPAVTYDVKVVVENSEVTGSLTTQPDELRFTPSATLHVNGSAATGGDGSAALPFQTIQEAVNHATPGTQVLVADGIYHEAVTFPASGNADQWIQVKAEGSGAVLDGSETLTGKIWTPHPSRAHIWFMPLRSSIGYLARDGQRFFKYDNLNGLMQTRGHGNVTINEGWYYDPTRLRLYVRSLDDPSRHTWQLPRLNHAFDINARNWVWIEGFEMRFYGTRTDGCGVCTLNASHVVIRNNKIHNMQLGIFINWNGTEDQGNDTRIEGNEISDPLVDEVPWKAAKGSSMEGTGIIVRGHIGAIVRNNEVHNFFNGIYTGSSAPNALENPAVAFDADIYNNRIHNISDDGLEPEGTCVNQRFRNNTIDKMLIGVSLAPITQGPVWVMRSTFTNFASSPIKWASNSDGVVFIYHNTSWTNGANLNAMSMITPVHNTVMRNNIFQGNRYAFEEPFTGSTGHDWNNDNWYTTRGSSGPHFKWEKIDYNTIKQLCTGTGLECNGYEDPPGLANPKGGDFTLLSSSPNIDRGVPIPGINDDFKGLAPDLGAYEYTLEPSPKVLSIARADANPTNATSVNFTVTFSEPVTGVDLAVPFADFALAVSSGISAASITSVTPVSESTYTVSVNTGSGDGTLRLDLLDDDSILNSKAQPLGGAGIANGSFTTGEVYTINKAMPAPDSASFKSVAVLDGWILESGENSNGGGTLDRNATTVNAGDDQKNRQYRSILSFDTSSLPDRAVIVSAQLKIKRQDIVGADPFGTHGVLVLEIRSGGFYNSILLQASDFSAPASWGSVRDSFAPLTSSWYAASLSSTNLKLINKFGATQFRVFFSRDDNDDRSADYIKFFSGNSTDENKPELTLTYYVP
jgi:hypothetical protein